MQRETAQCTAEDLGYQRRRPVRRDRRGSVNASAATLNIGNIGLAKATNEDLTEWEFLPPILSANCVTDQTERPQFILQGRQGAICSRSVTAAPSRRGMDGPEGVYGFVGDGIRPDFQPLNGGSGLALGNPTNLNFAGGQPFAPD